MLGSFDAHSAMAVPDGAVYVGFANDEWRVHLHDKSASTATSVVPDVVNPRNITWNRKTNTLAYVAADAQLMVRDLATGATTPLNVDQTTDRYTQPRYPFDGSRLLVVRLPEGKSRTTEVVEFVPGRDGYRTLVRKRSANFDPFAFDDKFLFYTSVACVEDCAGMIWELWRRDEATERQEQLSLANVVSRQPVTADGKWLYFSSNRAGHYHIWRMPMTVGGAAEQMTSGDVHDTDPAPLKDGTLYFIRRTPEKVGIMVRRADGSLDEVALPPGVEDVRNLEIREP